MVHSLRVLGGWGQLGYVIVCSKLGELVATVISAECKGPGLAAASHGDWYGVAAFVLVAALGGASVGCSTEDGWERSYFKTVFFTGLIFWAAAEVVIFVALSAMFVVGKLVSSSSAFTKVDLGGESSDHGVWHRSFVVAWVCSMS
mmetsp:Transcript_7579/g.16474  ORF Transcript_7579/g.16474 Transcript_7579/m.16474 type:complete len:145 (+) Transcript_7579:69-503(+)